MTEHEFAQPARRASAPIPSIPPIPKAPVDTAAARNKEAANQRDENLRLECLKLAVGKVAIGGTETFAQIVAGARTFYEFTQGLPPGGALAPAPTSAPAA